MIKYFASLIRVDATKKHSKKTPVFGTDRSRVSLPSVFSSVKEGQNVLDANNNNFHFLRF